MRKIETKSNCYAESNVDDLRNTMGGPSWKPLIVVELRAFIAIYLYTGLKKQPNIKTYWEKSSSIFHYSIISNIMTRGQFFQLRRCLHITNPASYEGNEREDPRYDKMRQVRWLVNEIREVCMREWVLGGFQPLMK